MLASLIAPVKGVFGQASTSGTPEQPAPAPPPSSYSTAQTPQYEPAAGAGYSTSPSGSRLAGTSQLGGGPPEGQSQLFTTGEGLLEWGMVHLYPHFVYQLSYGNGVAAVPGQQVDTMVNSFSPGVLVRLGPHWSLDYTATLTTYSSSQLKNAFDQAVGLNGTTAYEDWVFGVAIGFSDTSQPLVETGAQTDQQVFSTVLTAGYQLNSKVSFSLSFNQSFRFASEATQSAPGTAPGQLSDLTEWSTLDWVNYQVLPTVSVGLGVGVTYDSLSVGPDIVSEQAQARLQWIVGKRLSAYLSGGLNDQQYVGSSVGDFLSPIFSLTLQYQLFEATSLFVNASSGTSPSYYGGQASQSTGISAGVHQRLLRRLFLDVSGGYWNTTYHATTASPNTPGLSDYDSASFNVALGTTLFKRLGASVFYNTLFNTSGSELYNYTTHEVGLTLSYSF
ncbi:MAG TPA: hypothetical protein VMU04_15380 [Candidatus Acidoferrum sp.]|nr:hypothetical protein [Candidatus Acidoferrum sp.]